MESEKAKEVPGLNPEVFPNIQFTRTVDRNPAGLSVEFWKKVAEKLFQNQGVKAPEQGLDKEQEIEMPEDYTGDDPDHSVENIY